LSLAPFAFVPEARRQYELVKLARVGDSWWPECCCDGFCADRTYECAGCFRDVPWCYGAHDDMPDYCDDCWDAVPRDALGERKMP
jgi:hypothetical protein